jgi:hypothetical protein
MILSSDWNPLDKRTNNHLPCREIPSVVPFNSEMSWNLDLIPVITALRDICMQSAGERRGYAPIQWGGDEAADQLVYLGAFRYSGN